MNGYELRDMLSAAVAWLEKSALDINALNVFPVPDGDCGTNMLLTFQSAVEEAFKVTDNKAGSVAAAIAEGALMGARGNSGVISSQIWRGFAQAFKDKEVVTAADWANAWTQAEAMAYKSLTNPVEGTILTVIKDVATTARNSAADNDSIYKLLEATVKTASESVAKTPLLLPVLREAGVVDAGGQGLFTILEGMLYFLRDETEQMQFKKSRVIVSSEPVSANKRQLKQADDEPFGYCTEFLLKGEGLDPEKIRASFKQQGKSLIVVGDNTTVRVHIHTSAPGLVLDYATKIGTVHKVNIRNMDEQYEEDFLALQKDRQSALDIAVVAIVAGDGFADVFSSLNATAVVPGGQTMNPSTKDILQAVEHVACDQVIILPNNKNIISAAELVKQLTNKNIAVVPTKTLPQGVSALRAFDYDATFEINVQRMTEAALQVHTIEITRASRDTKLNKLVIKKNQSIGLFDDHLSAVNESSEKVLADLLARTDFSKVKVITLYHGADTTADDADSIANKLITQYPSVQVDVVWGGQPHYDYIVALE
jgi:DAK2 domain fusion protein YloV